MFKKVGVNCLYIDEFVYGKELKIEVPGSNTNADLWDKDIAELKIYKAVAEALKNNETKSLTKNQKVSKKINIEGTDPHNIFIKWLKK